MKTALRDGGLASAGRALARVLLLTVAVGSLAVACSDENETAACSDAAIDFSLPTETLTDWVSYSDQLSVVEVVGAERLWPPPPTSGAPPDEYVGRRVDIRVGETPGGDPPPRSHPAGCRSLPTAGRSEAVSGPSPSARAPASRSATAI